MKRGIATAVAWTTLSALAACGSGPEAALTTGVTEGGAPPAVTATTSRPLRPAAPPARPVCELLSAQDIAGALGNPVRAGTGDPKFCSWGTRVDGGTSADVRVAIPAAGEGQQECAAQQSSLPKSATFESVGGVGNAGVWAWQRLTLLVQGHLVACWSDAVVRVLLTGEQDPSILRGKAVALAETTKSRL